MKPNCGVTRSQQVIKAQRQQHLWRLQQQTRRSAIHDYYQRHPERRGSSLGLATAGGVLGAMVGGPVGGLVGGVVGWVFGKLR